MTHAKSFILPAGAALILIGYYLWQSGTDKTESADVTAVTEKAEREPTRRSPSAAPRTEHEPTPARPETQRATPPKRLRVRSQAARERERAEREALLQRIQQAQRTRLQRPESEPIEPGALGSLSRDYIRDRIAEDLVPLAEECYELALSDSPDLQGRLALHFRIEGEPDAGGLVVEAEPTDDSEIQHPGLVECMRESMMSVSFDPPENGGAIEVTYPFVFEPEAP